MKNKKHHKILWCSFLNKHNTIFPHLGLTDTRHLSDGVSESIDYLATVSTNRNNRFYFDLYTAV